MAQFPSRESGYKAPVKLDLTRELWDAVFGDIDARLDAAEAKVADYDDAIDKLNQLALEAVSANLTAEIEQFRVLRQDAITALQAITDAYDLLKQGVIYADLITLSAEVPGIGQGTVQQAIAKLANLAVKTSDDTKVQLSRASVDNYFLGAL